MIWGRSIMKNGKVILSVKVSVDGYLCALNGSTSLLQKYYQEFLPAGVDLVYPTDCEAVLFGRKTFEQYPTQLGQLAKKGLKLIVAAHEDHKNKGNAIRVQGELPEALKQVQHKLHSNIWIAGGASVINQLTSANFVDEIRLTTVPVRLGSGKALFDADLQAPHVSLTEIKQYGGLTYSVWNKN